MSTPPLGPMYPWSQQSIIHIHYSVYFTWNFPVDTAGVCLSDFYKTMKQKASISINLCSVGV